MSYQILCDTREQQPWEFSEKDWEHGSVRATLKTGDYTLQGFEDVLTIDRKGKASELATNLTDKRFERELERLQDFKYPFIVCDFPLSDLLQFPFIPEVPSFVRKKIRARGPFLVSILETFWLRFKTKWIFTEHGDGKNRALGLFKRVLSEQRSIT